MGGLACPGCQQMMVQRATASKSSVCNSECVAQPGNHAETGPIFTGLWGIALLWLVRSVRISLPLPASVGFGNCFPDHLEYISPSCHSWSLFCFLIKELVYTNSAVVITLLCCFPPFHLHISSASRLLWFDLEMSPMYVKTWASC